MEERKERIIESKGEKHRREAKKRCKGRKVAKVLKERRKEENKLSCEESKEGNR